MLRTSLSTLTRRLAHLRNTSYPNVVRGQNPWCSRTPHNSVALFRRLGIYACATTAALVVYHSQDPVVLLDARLDPLESARGLPPLVYLKHHVP